MAVISAPDSTPKEVFLNTFSFISIMNICLADDAWLAELNHGAFQAWGMLIQGGPGMIAQAVTPHPGLDQNEMRRRTGQCIAVIEYSSSLWMYLRSRVPSFKLARFHP
jgi:hypothetical protein